MTVMESYRLGDPEKPWGGPTTAPILPMGPAEYRKAIEILIAGLRAHGEDVPLRVTGKSREPLARALLYILERLDDREKAANTALASACADKSRMLDQRERGNELNDALRDVVLAYEQRFKDTRGRLQGPFDHEIREAHKLLKWKEL